MLDKQRQNVWKQVSWIGLPSPRVTRTCVVGKLPVHVTPLVVIIAGACQVIQLVMVSLVSFDQIYHASPLFLTTIELLKTQL